MEIVWSFREWQICIYMHRSIHSAVQGWIWNFWSGWKRIHFRRKQNTRMYYMRMRRMRSLPRTWNIVQQQEHASLGQFIEDRHLFWWIIWKEAVWSRWSEKWIWTEIHRMDFVKVHKSLRKKQWNGWRMCSIKSIKIRCRSWHLVLFRAVRMSF